MFIDSAFLVLMILAVIKGYRKGLVVAAFSFVGIIIGMAAAVKLSAVVAATLKSYTHIAVGWLPFLAFIIVLIGVMILVKLGAKLVEASLEMILLGWFNRLAGIILYALLYATTFSILLFYGDKLHILKPAMMEGSKTYEFIQPLAPRFMELFARVLPFFQGVFEELSTFFAGLNH
ncbi:MAG: CvpA family protein [Chitinophagaceae bacterium]|nr:CvpA family protein [Chitinophagaceae bacterium]